MICLAWIVSTLAAIVATIASSNYYAARRRIAALEQDIATLEHERNVAVLSRNDWMTQASKDMNALAKKYHGFTRGLSEPDELVTKWRDQLGGSEPPRGFDDSDDRGEI